jgi:DNA-binding response OmpR family regulator
MGRESILMIDDDADFANAIRLVLENAGYRVEVAHNPKDGFAALEKETFGLVILDVMMGRGAEGIIAARKLKKQKDLKIPPILMLTGIREQTGFFFVGDPKHDTYLPVDGFLEKPVENTVLLAEVERLLRSTEKGESKE